MKSPIAALVLISSLAASPAWGQAQAPTFGGAQPNPPRSPITDAGGAPAENRVVNANSGTPALTPANDLKPPTLALPSEPIEPYLLSKENGPFMVLARTFRGPDAERMALALVKGAAQRLQIACVHSANQRFPGQKFDTRHATDCTKQRDGSRRQDARENPHF